MKVVHDSNVFISGVFFGGPPGKILQGWRDGKFSHVLTPEILEEYQRVADVLSKKSPPVDLTELLELIVVEADMIQAKPMKEPVSADPDDHVHRLRIGKRCQVDRHRLAENPAIGKNCSEIKEGYQKLPTGGQSSTIANFKAHHSRLSGYSMNRWMLRFSFLQIIPNGTSRFLKA
ncbi:MAG: hypothetical protein C0622_13425 [Desulfuromonas sp.]|nr:MAG: hypothetical protein C0622_13425 [Desulfuromonas sp.]